MFPEWKIERVSGNDINTAYRRYPEIRSTGAAMIDVTTLSSECN